MSLVELVTFIFIDVLLMRDANLRRVGGLMAAVKHVVSKPFATLTPEAVAELAIDMTRSGRCFLTFCGVNGR